MELGLAWSRWKCFRDIKVRAFFNLAEHTLRKRDGPIPEDWPALQSPLLPVPFSLHVTPRNSSLSLFPFHRSMEPPQMRTNFSPTFLFSLSLLLWRGEGKKKCQACNDRESWTRLESVSPPNGRQPMSNSSLRNRLSRFLRPPLTLPLFLSLSLSPPPPLSNEQLRRNWINLDGEKFREAEQPAKTLFRVALQWGHGFVLKGTRMDFRISDPEWLSIFPWNRAQLSRPCAKEEGEGKARGGIIKIFHRCSISLRPGGAASKNTESKYFEKIGSSEIRKSGPERNSCWGERIARKRQREGEGGRENSGENGAWRRVSAFIESRKKSLEIGPISATSLCDGSIELKFVEEKAKALRIIRFVLIFRFAFRLQPLFIFFPSLLLSLFSFFPVSFFFLPFLLPRRARRERERIRNWVGEEANHAEKMKYRGKLRVRGKTQTRA